MSTLLWRDVRAMSKDLRKRLEAAGQKNAALDLSGCTTVVQEVWQGCSAPMSWSARNSQPLPPSLTLTVGNPSLPQGLLLGKTRKTSWIKRPQDVFVSDTGLLRQVLVCGCDGSGRTETLLTMAMNAADLGKGVLYVDAKGDNSLYAKAFAGLSERQQIGNLRVINLMSRHPSLSGKHSHSLDLFDGFDERALSGWLLDMLPEVADKTAATQSLPLIAKLTLAWACQENQRLLPSHVCHALSQGGLENIAQNLPPDMAHLARQVVAKAWGRTPQPGWAETMASLSRTLAILYRSYAHVFEQASPEVGLTQLYRPALPDKPWSRPQRLFLLVLGPAMEQAPEELQPVMRAITASLRQSILLRPQSDRCDTVAIVDEFNSYETASSLSQLSQLQDRGCGFVWGAQEILPSLHGAGWCMPGTHVLMRSYGLGEDHHGYAGKLEAVVSPGVVSTLSKLDFVRQDVGEAVIFDKQDVVRVKMDYKPTNAPESLFLIRVPSMEPPAYPAPAPPQGLSHFDIDRQAGILRDRWQQWELRNSGSMPPLSWCQETVARMLGYANWHEANTCLAP